MRGRGAFETMRVYGGRPFELDRAPRPPRRLVRAAWLRVAAARGGRAAGIARARCGCGRRGDAPRLRDAGQRRAARDRRRRSAAGGPRRAARARHPADLGRVPAGRPDRRRQVDELRPEHDRRRRRAGGGRGRRSVPRRGRHRARGDDLERLVAGWRARVHADGRARHPRRRDAERAPGAQLGRSATRWKRAGSPSPIWPEPTRRSRPRPFAR